MTDADGPAVPDPDPDGRTVPVSASAEPRAFTAVVNPVSGSGRAYERWVPIAARLAGAGADVRVELSRSGGHATELAAAAAAAGRIVVAVGGDGQVRAVAGGVVPAAGTMAVVAAGRGNDLARRLGLPTDVDSLATLLRAGPARALDVIEVTGGTPTGGATPGTVIVPGNVYAGVDSVANEIVNRSKRIPALLAYRLAPLRAVAGWRPPSYALTVDGRTRAVTAHTVVVANSGAYGHGLAIVPSAEPDDGLLDVMVVGAGPRRAVAAFLRQARRGTHVERREIDISPARQVRIAADRDVPVYGDGDEVGRLPVSLRVRPGALKLLVDATKPATCG